MSAGNIKLTFRFIHLVCQSNNWVGGVADLSIYDLIGCSHGNIGRFTDLNAHCSFTTVYKSADEMPHWALTGGYFWSVGLLHSTSAVSEWR